MTPTEISLHYSKDTEHSQTLMVGGKAIKAVDKLIALELRLEKVRSWIVSVGLLLQMNKYMSSSTSTYKNNNNEN